MGVWRYCECGAGLDRISLEDLESISYDVDAKVRCTNCETPRQDDSPEERFSILLAEVMRLRANESAIVSTLRKIGRMAVALKGQKSP